MFCDGQCIRKKRNGDIISRCGLYGSVTTENVMNKEVKTFDRCVFYGAMDNLSSIIKSVDRLHAAMNESRNTESEAGYNIVKTVATGFLGMIHCFTGNEEAQKKLRDLGAIGLGAIEQQQKIALEEKKNDVKQEDEQKQIEG